MKKKVVIERVPTKSSKKKVVIEGLPKAQAGIITTGRDPQIMEQTQNLLMDKIKRDNERSKLGITSSARPRDYDLMMQNQKMLQDKIQADNAKVKKFFTPNKNVNFNIPHLYPTVGNRYLQEAVMDFNDAATYASNIGRQPKDVTLPAPNYNPYVNMYYGEHGGYLPVYQPGGQWGQFTNNLETPYYTTPPANLQQEPIIRMTGETNNELAPLQTEGLQEIQLGQNTTSTTQGSNPWVTAGAIAGTVAKIGSGITKGIKGGLDIAGSTLANRAAQQAENQLYTQSVFSDAMNVTPYETQGYGFLGRNSLAADGMQIREIGGKGEPNIIDAPELNGYFRRKR